MTLPALLIGAAFGGLICFLTTVSIAQVVCGFRPDAHDGRERDHG